MAVPAVRLVPGESGPAVLIRTIRAGRWVVLYYDVSELEAVPVAVLGN